MMQALTTSNPNALTDESYARFTTIAAAAETLMNEYSNVTFIDYDTVQSWNVEISDDNTHPTAKGYATLTDKIAEFLGDTYK